MASTEERMQILKMIEEGKITAAEGAELLRALDKNKTGQEPEPLRGSSNPRWFRVRVTDLASGRNKVNVNIPIGLVHVGIKMGARFVPELGEEAEYQQVIEAIRSGKQGKIIEVEDDGERVEIFVE
ncbi:MAG: hypothetical protein Kow0080_18590 [Candidatus Promineifilaceae bacterium]